MAKKEAQTDLWVTTLLTDALGRGNFTPQGSTIKDVDEALQSASKNGKGNAGYPEFTSLVKDYLIVIEDKADLSKHEKLTGGGYSRA